MTDFVTVQDVSDRLGRDVTADPGAVSAVSSACAICRTISEQTFDAGTSTVTLDGSGTDVLILAERPVLAAGTVVVNGAAELNFTVTRSGMLFRGSAGSNPRPVWPLGRQNVVVTYEHGFEVFTVPADVCEVALNLAMRLVVQGVARSESVAGVSVTYDGAADDLTVNELRILKRYRGAASR